MMDARPLAVVATLFASLCAIAAQHEPHALPGVRATEASIGYVGAVAVSPAGEVHFSASHAVYRIVASEWLVRVAGTGKPGLSGDGGPAVAAQLNFPQWYPERVHDPIDFSELVGPLAFDAMGNLLIGDAFNDRVRRVDASGLIETVLTGTRWPQGIAVDREGNLLVSDGSGVLARMTPDRRVTGLTANDCGRHHAPGLCAPTGMAVDSAGNAFVADAYCRVRRVTPDGSVRTVAGRGTPDGRGFAFTCGHTGDGPAATSALGWPFAVAIDSEGNLLIADTYNHCIRRVDLAEELTTIAGKCGKRGFVGDGGPAREAELNQPHGVAVDSAGNLYIADSENFRVRKVDVDGVITTIAGNGEPGCTLVKIAWGLPGCATP